MYPAVNFSVPIFRAIGEHRQQFDKYRNKKQIRFLLEICIRVRVRRGRDR